jgi:hypothetical protein
MPAQCPQLIIGILSRRTSHFPDLAANPMLELLSTDLNTQLQVQLVGPVDCKALEARWRGAWHARGKPSVEGAGLLACFAPLDKVFVGLQSHSLRQAVEDSLVLRQIMELTFCSRRVGRRHVFVSVFAMLSAERLRS